MPGQVSGLGPVSFGFKLSADRPQRIALAPKFPDQTDGLLFGGGLRLLGSQALGAAAVAVFTFGVAVAVWGAIKAVAGLRVSRAEEVGGLDVGEHGMEAYPDFQGFLTK